MAMMMAETAKTRDAKPKPLESRSPRETVAFGRRLGEAYRGGACFYLEGALGTGKTLLAKGIASAFGVEPDQVVSPTFALVNRYSGEGRKVYHVDLYRINNERELVELGLEEIEEEEGAVIIVEWPEKLGRYRRSDAVTVRFETLDDGSRVLHVIQPGGESS